MTSSLLAFGWSVLFVAISVAEPTLSNSKQLKQNSKQTTAIAVDDLEQDKCTIVVNGNSFCAGPNKEMETLLRGIQAQLSEMQQQLLEIKPVTRKETGVGVESFKPFFFYFSLILRQFTCLLIKFTLSFSIERTKRPNCCPLK